MVSCSNMADNRKFYNMTSETMRFRSKLIKLYTSNAGYRHITYVINRQEVPRSLLYCYCYYYFETDFARVTCTIEADHSGVEPQGRILLDGTTISEVEESGMMNTEPYDGGVYGLVE